MPQDQDPIARSQIHALRARVEDLERHLRRLYDQLGFEVPTMNVSSGDAVEAEILPLLQQGNMIEAITTYRTATGSDLSSAKDAVERIKAEHGL